MIEKFESYISKLIKLKPTDKVVLAVSGGADSMVMLKLFHDLGINVVVAHCNFKLRGEESERDQKFVEEISSLLDIPCHVVSFETEKIASERKISIQMAARELRYNWFEELRAGLKFDFIATAHHQDDQAETFFINLIRGTGHAGLHGILPRRGNLIRPLLFAQRADIEEYALRSNISFITDSSNFSDKYLRNFIRHNILPSFVGLNKNFISNLANTISELRVLENTFITDVHQKFSGMINIVDEKIILEINNVKSLDYHEFYLKEFLSQYGFSKAQVDDIIETMDSPNSGQKFFGSKYSITKNRNELIISPSVIFQEDDTYLIDNCFTCECELPINLEFEIIETSLEIDKSNGIAQLDFDKLQFPLKLRKWKYGDEFMPLGMKGMKLVSDFLIDIKLSVVDKAKTYVLLSGDDIVWIINHRVDDRYKISKDTTKVLKIKSYGLS